MKLAIVILGLFILFGLNSRIKAEPAVDSSGKSIIEVETNYTEIYDDGVYRKLYDSFEIKDQNGKTILCVPKELDKPAQVKLSVGTYILSTITSIGDTITKKVDLTKDQYGNVRLK